MHLTAACSCCVSDVAGKYLNVIRECNQNVESALQPGQHITYDTTHSFQHLVTVAHSHASSVLLQLLVKDQQLISLLRSVKHYFLLDKVRCCAGRSALEVLT